MFSCPAIIPDHGIKSMSDKGLRVMVDTQELTPSQMAELFSLKGQYGFFAYDTQPVDESQIDRSTVSEGTPAGNSPSKRLRSVLFRLWEQAPAGLDFDTYYRSKMESIIDKLKEHL